MYGDGLMKMLSSIILLQQLARVAGAACTGRGAGQGIN
jgi:hypothetical protein